MANDCEHDGWLNMVELKHGSKLLLMIDDGWWSRIKLQPLVVVDSSNEFVNKHFVIADHHRHQS